MLYKTVLTNQRYSGSSRVVDIHTDIDQAIEVSQLLHKFNFDQVGSVLTKIAKVTEILVHVLT